MNPQSITTPPAKRHSIGCYIRWAIAFPGWILVTIPCDITWNIGQWLSDKVQTLYLRLGAFGERFERHRYSWILTGKILKKCAGCQSLQEDPDDPVCPACQTPQFP